MTDIGMLFSSPMIRALAREAWKTGDGKTETRRIASPHNIRLFTGTKMVRPTAELLAKAFEDARDVRHVDAGTWVWTAKAFPYQQVGRTHWQAEVLPKVGDRIWTRETWAPLSALKHNDPGTTALAEGGFFFADDSVQRDHLTGWTPAIHQPKNKSRFTLLVTKVRLQRLQQISEEDAKAEGISKTPQGWWSCDDSDPKLRATLAGCDARGAYYCLWQHIHGAGNWDKNPWVVATTFTVHRVNIDRMPAVAA